MKVSTLLACFLFVLFAGAIGQTKKLAEITFKTRDGHSIRLTANYIYYDGKTIFKHKYPGDVRIGIDKDHLVESGGAVFLFITTNGAPNLDPYKVYQITPTGAKFITESTASPIEDYDKDGDLEFGGRDLTEVHPSCDSMYYIPTQYFEISKGRIALDKKLTIKMDKKINGIYLSQPLDESGNCCKVIPITKSERIAERKQKNGGSGCKIR